MEIIEVIELTIAVASSLFAGIMLFVLRSMQQRITSLENKNAHYMAKAEVRELIEDKIGGLREDITEIKDKINQLFEFYIHDHKSR